MIFPFPLFFFYSILDEYYDSFVHTTIHGYAKNFTHHTTTNAFSFIHEKGKVINQTENCMRRTASLDQLTVKNNYTKTPTPCIFWQLDKATQTDESCLSDRPALFESPSEKMEKVIKHRIQRQSYRSACEHSVSSQTLSPMHGKYIYFYW